MCPCPSGPTPPAPMPCCTAPAGSSGASAAWQRLPGALQAHATTRNTCVSHSTCFIACLVVWRQHAWSPRAPPVQACPDLLTRYLRPGYTPGCPTPQTCTTSPAHEQRQRQPPSSFRDQCCAVFVTTDTTASHLLPHLCACQGSG